MSVRLGFLPGRNFLCTMIFIETHSYNLPPAVIAQGVAASCAHLVHFTVMVLGAYVRLYYGHRYTAVLAGKVAEQGRQGRFYVTQPFFFPFSHKCVAHSSPFTG